MGVKGWGGKRAGAGRPNLSGQVNHMRRPRVTIKAPFHVTMRIKKGLPSLRKKDLFKEFKEGIKRARGLGLYVIHFSIQSNHIHLFCESASNRAVALGMRALAGRFAKFVNARGPGGIESVGNKRSRSGKASGGKNGSVFDGRYHLRVLKTPTETRNALEYVLLNTAKHRNVIEHVDPFSSGRAFHHWSKLLGKRFRSLIKFDANFYALDTDLQETLSEARSWLGQTGWMKACG
jgi:REP element-mobilizing transposase RayT